MFGSAFLSFSITQLFFPPLAIHCIICKNQAVVVSFWNLNYWRLFDLKALVRTITQFRLMAAVVIKTGCAAQCLILLLVKLGLQHVQSSLGRVSSDRTGCVLWPPPFTGHFQCMLRDWIEELGCCHGWIRSPLPLRRCPWGSCSRFRIYRDEVFLGWVGRSKGWAVNAVVTCILAGRNSKARNLNWNAEIFLSCSVVIKN